eukprot:scaffold1642_cov252-Pinguiococcus_pyrenoidosus.AAC.15
MPEAAAQAVPPAVPPVLLSRAPAALLLRLSRGLRLRAVAEASLPGVAAALPLSDSDRGGD